MVKETPGLAGTNARTAVRGSEMRARASDIVDATAERGRRIYGSAVNGAADAMSSASDTVEAVGERAHSAGNAIRRRTRRTARTITRGEKRLRASEPGEIVGAAAAAVRRHTFAFAMVGAAVVAFITVMMVRRRNGES